MKTDNPFSLDFGAKPNLYIPRLEEQNRIISTFSSTKPSSHIFMLIGARGTGKTVLMTSISHELRNNAGWLHIDLGNGSDVLNSLAAYLVKESKILFPKLKFDITVKGLGISVDKDEKYSDITADLDTMIHTLNRKNVKILVTVDEVSNSKGIRDFMTYYQHCIREEMDIFVLMTGLYKNIRALQNNKTLTFLKRVPKIILEPLNLMRISKKYEDIFDLDRDSSMKMAYHTSGYSYGFQILGYILYDSGKNVIDDNVLSEYITCLEENSYEKIWEELSAEERRVAISIAKMDTVPDVKDVRDDLDMNSNKFSTYKDTLTKSGILSDKKARGKVGFNLPYFKEFVIRQSQIEYL